MGREAVGVDGDCVLVNFYASFNVDVIRQARNETIYTLLLESQLTSFYVALTHTHLMCLLDT